MIEGILPAEVIAVEAHEDDDAAEASLFDQEKLIVAQAVTKRRREFTTARMCARAALQRLGMAPLPILTGDRGEPIWPQGVVGSITHCEGYRGCAVGRSEEILTIGIDAEPNAPLPPGLLGDIALPQERPALLRLREDFPEMNWDRLLFSAKESVYKAWFPLTGRWLGFEDAQLELDASAGTFEARLLVAATTLPTGSLLGFAGRWMARGGVLLTAIAVNAVEPSGMLGRR